MNARTGPDATEAAAAAWQWAIQPPWHLGLIVAAVVALIIGRVWLTVLGWRARRRLVWGRSPADYGHRARARRGRGQ